MKVLVLHNNNVPFFLRNPRCPQIGEVFFEAKMLKYDSNIETRGFDSYVSSQLAFLKDSSYDIILLPFTLSDENYLEYTGLRIAVHIRLTPSWKKLTTPILFIGPDSHDDVMILSKLGSIVNSYHVFMTSQKEKEELITLISGIVMKYPCDDDGTYVNSISYKNMLDSLIIKAPANYATHHSIANEWACLRWADMIKWGNKVPEIKDKSVLDLLYFKYLLSKVAVSDGERELFDKKYKKKNPTSPIIPGIEGKKIICFDDEGENGWYELLECIFTESKATLIPFPISKELSKEQLLSDAMSFANSNEGDCYLVDLRLHDDDFESDAKPEKMSGLLLANYLKNDEKNGNRGRQIVFFSASNKLWNYEKIQSIIGPCSFIVKESPEYNYNRKESDANFSGFKNAIKKAIDKSYISDYVDRLNQCQTMKAESWNALNQFVDMLLYDEKNTVKYNVLNLYIFIDSYLSSKYYLDASQLLLNSDSTPLCEYNPLFVIIDQREREDGYKHIRFRQSLYEHFNTRTEHTLDITQDSEFPVVMVSLHYYYKMTEENCNKIQRLRTERNRCVAHNGGATNMSISDIRDIFDNIVIPIIKKDFSQ